MVAIVAPAEEQDELNRRALDIAAHSDDPTRAPVARVVAQQHRLDRVRRRPPRRGARRLRGGSRGTSPAGQDRRHPGRALVRRANAARARTRRRGTRDPARRWPTSTPRPALPIRTSTRKSPRAARHSTSNQNDAVAGDGLAGSQCGQDLSRTGGVTRAEVRRSSPATARLWALSLSTTRITSAPPSRSRTRIRRQGLLVAHSGLRLNADQLIRDPQQQSPTTFASAGYCERHLGGHPPRLAEESTGILAAAPDAHDQPIHRPPGATPHRARAPTPPRPPRHLELWWRSRRTRTSCSGTPTIRPRGRRLSCWH